MTGMATRTISWNDVLEVGQGGPGCGLLQIDGRLPKGGYRYLPPAMEHDGIVYASCFVPGGFVLCAIDPATMVRRPISDRLRYARIVGIEAGEIVYADDYHGDSTARHPISRPQPFIARLAARFGKR